MNDSLEEIESDVLIEDRCPGNQMIITFGFAQWDRPVAFEFRGRLKKIEWILGHTFQKIHLRDSQLAWYLKGVRGLGQDLHCSLARLIDLTQQLRPSRLVTIGQSMGGYGAIAFGAAIAADRVVAFGPLSTMDSTVAMQGGDRRWLSLMQRLAAEGIDEASTDLIRCLERRSTLPELRLHYGCQPDSPEHGPENLDLFHARRFQAIPGTKVFLYPDANHAVVEHLRSTFRLDAILLSELFDVPIHRVHSRSQPKLSDEWIRWIAENRIRNAEVSSMIRAMETDGIDAITARSAIAAVMRDPLYALAEGAILRNGQR